MAMTVDDLLNADYSSDEEDAKPSTNNERSDLDGTGDKPRSSAPKVALTVEEALAQGDLSDEDDDLLTPMSRPAEPPPAEPSTQAAAGAIPDDISGDPPPSSHQAPEKSPVNLESLLAMEDDSSDEDNLQAPSAAPQQSGSAAQARLSPSGGEQGIERRAAAATGGEDAKQAASNAPRETNGFDAFLRAPFDWCLEHERSLLLANADDAASAEQSESRVEGAPEIRTPASLIQVRSCPELKHGLAQEYGLPTCVMTHSRHVGVGSIRGQVVLLDAKIQDATPQPTVLCPPNPEDAVPVTSGAFSADGNSLLVGHKNGQLVLWDLNTQKVTNLVKDLHSCPVLSVAFCRPSRQYALSADARGSVYFLTFTTSVLGRPDCLRQLLLEQSSKIGVTLRILPLPQANLSTPHPVDSQCLVALCATNATVLLTLHPSVQLLQKMQYNAKDGSTPSTTSPDAAWLRVYSQTEDNSQVQSADPRLCVAFGQTIHIMRVSCERMKNKEEFIVRLEQRYSWSLPIQSLVPFNESVLAVLDVSNKLSVVQLPSPPEEGSAAKPSSKEAARQLEAVHTEDVGGLSVVYHTLTLEGNRDIRSHHGGLAVFRGKSRTLYICGMKEVWSLQVGRWGQHIEELINRNNWSAALDVFLALYRGSLPSLLDFPHVVSARQRAVGRQSTQAIQSYLQIRLQPDTGRAQTRQMCLTAVNACIEMKLWSVLYKTVFECFKAAGHMNVYCNTLEPFIVQGRIPRGQMDSEVLSSILQSYQLPLEEEEQLALQHFKESSSNGSAAPLFVDSDHCASLFPIARRLQQLVFYVDVSQLDLNFAIRLFTQHRLWTALVHVDCALKDYVSPLELLIGECSQLAKKCFVKLEDGKPQCEGPLLHCHLVRKLFFFLQRCFELRPFPLDSKDGTGIVPPATSAIPELLRCIFRGDAGLAGDGPVRAPSNFLRLLRLSPMSFFSVLSVLFTSPQANHVIQSHGANDTSCILGSPHPQLSLSSLFQAIESAVEASRAQAEDEGQALPEHTDDEFLWFVARAAPKANCKLSIGRLVQVVEHLLTPQQRAGSSSSSSLAGHTAEEAQQLLIGVFASQENLDKARRDDFIAKAMQRGFYQLASWLHEEHGEYDRALDCQLRDDVREGIFEYIISRLAEKATDQASSTSLVEATLQRLPRLVAIDAEMCAAMVCEQFASVADHDRVLERLAGYPQIEKEYLETLMTGRRRNIWKNSEEQESFFNGHVVRYVELLCVLTPESVLPFLAENEKLPLRQCLELCRKHCVINASVYLYERTGDFVAVLELLLSDYTKALEQLHKSFIEGAASNHAALSKVVKRLEAISKVEGMHSKESKPGNSAWWEGFADAQRCMDLLEQVQELSSRNSNLMTTAQLEELWFGVLGATIRWQERMSASRNVSRKHAGLATALAELASRAMAGVLAYLELKRSLQRICAEFGSSTLGIWQDPLQSMLSGLSFQLGLLGAAKEVAAQDVMKPFEAVKRRGSRGVRVSPKRCTLSSDGTLKVPLGSPGARAAAVRSPESAAAALRSSGR